MLNKVGTLAETSAIFITLIGFLPSVNSLVLNEIRAMFKPLATLIAFIGLFLSMDPSMLNEIWTLEETFPTINTFMGFLSRINLLVLKKSWALTETLFTFSALIGLLLPNFFLVYLSLSQTEQSFPISASGCRFCAGSQRLFLGLTSEKFLPYVFLTSWRRAKYIESTLFLWTNVFLELCSSEFSVCRKKKMIC